MAISHEHKHAVLEELAHDEHPGQEAEHPHGLTQGHDIMRGDAANDEFRNHAANDAFKEKPKKPFAEQVGGSVKHHKKHAARQKTGSRQWLENLLNSPRATSHQKQIAAELLAETPEDPLRRH